MGYDDNLHELIDLLPTDKRQQVYHLVQAWVKPDAEPVAKHWQNSSLARRMRMPIIVTEDITPLTRDEIYGRQQSNADTGMTFAEMLLSMPRLDSSEWHEGLFERDQTSCREVEF